MRKPGPIKQAFFIILYLSDVLMFIDSMLISFLLVYGFSVQTLGFLLSQSNFFIFTLLVLLINYAHYNLYSDKRNLFDSNEIVNIGYSLGITLSISLFLVLLLGVTDMAFLMLMCLAFIITFMLTVIARIILYNIVYAFRKRGYDLRNVVFYGKGTQELQEKIKENKLLGYVLGGKAKDLKELKSLLGKADIVFVTQEHIDEKLLELMITHDKVSWKIIPSTLNLVIEPVRFDEFKDYPIINVARTNVNTGYMGLKRVLDITLSGTAIVVLSPLLVAISILIKVLMPGPVLFKQERLGKDLQPFMVYKFRSMVVGADNMKKDLKNEVKGLFKMKEDPRITPFGSFLRRTNLDELPQIFNIFKGEMSIVGPRPHLRSELVHFKGWRQERFKVKPGLTGLWQVNGRHELNFDKAVLYDIFYIKHMSLFMDISIILKTIPSILLSRGRH